MSNYTSLPRGFPFSMPYISKEKPRNVYPKRHVVPFYPFRFRPPAFFSTRPVDFLPFPASDFPFGRFSPPFSPTFFALGG